MTGEFANIWSGPSSPISASAAAQEVGRRRQRRPSKQAFSQISKLLQIDQMLSPPSPPPQQPNSAVPIPSSPFPPPPPFVQQFLLQQQQQHVATASQSDKGIIVDGNSGGDARGMVNLFARSPPSTSPGRGMLLGAPSPLSLVMMSAAANAAAAAAGGGNGHSPNGGGSSPGRTGNNNSTAPLKSAFSIR